MHANSTHGGEPEATSIRLAKDGPSEVMLPRAHHVTKRCSAPSRLSRTARIDREGPAGVQMSRQSLAVFIAVATTACTTPGTLPHDMSVAEHEYAAASASGSELALQHLAAARALRGAEETACAGLERRDRALEPIFRSSDVQWTAMLRDDRGSRSQVPRGAVLALSAAPSLEPALLHRRIDCHLARVAAVGEVSQLGVCPLGLLRVQARVRVEPTGTFVEIRSGDRDTAEEIWRRARELAGEPQTSSSANAASTLLNAAAGYR